MDRQGLALVVSQSHGPWCSRRKNPPQGGACGCIQRFCWRSSVSACENVLSDAAGLALDSAAGHDL